MNKYILPYSNSVNESIGIGSVVLIKGKPTKIGRFLYVTTIKGFVEIKPGIKMVFVDDVVYRVFHKGGDKFSGRKIDYRGEDGLKGVFNMKNPGKPSVVLNHNKTPFHWITVEYLDIGSALRAVGPNLFSHELILLESATLDPDIEAKNFVLREVTKLLLGISNIFKLIDVEVEEGGINLNDIDMWDTSLSIDDNERSGSLTGYDTLVHLILTTTPNQVPSEHLNYLYNIGMLPLGLGFEELDNEDRMLLGAEDTSHGYVSISYETDAHIEYNDVALEVYDSSSRLVSTDSGKNILYTAFAIDGEQVDAPNDIVSDLKLYDRTLLSSLPSDIVNDLTKLISDN